MEKRLFLSILVVAGISIFTFSGTYAYILASKTEGFTVETEEGVHSKVEVNNIVLADTLIPIADELIPKAISKEENKCIDNNQYQVCSLYKVTLTNSATPEELYGYIRTGKTTYATDNLMYQIFDESYSPLSSAASISRVENGIVYFSNGEDKYLTNSTGSITYYLAVWLTETNTSQHTDYGKTFTGYVGFESAKSVQIGARRIEATFDA